MPSLNIYLSSFNSEAQTTKLLQLSLSELLIII